MNKSQIDFFCKIIVEKCQHFELLFVILDTTGWDGWVRKWKWLFYL